MRARYVNCTQLMSESVEFPAKCSRRNMTHTQRKMEREELPAEVLDAATNPP